jgi:hypothetical protein
MVERMCEDSRMLNYREDILSAPIVVGVVDVAFRGIGQKWKDVQLMMFRRMAGEAQCCGTLVS